MKSLSKIATVALLTSSGSATNLFGVELESKMKAVNDAKDKINDVLAAEHVRSANSSGKLPVGHASPYDDMALEVDPDTFKTFDQICSENDYGTEHHPVTTSDGYKLNMFRIVAKNFKKGSPVVFLQHGITDSADAWIMNYADKSIAFNLAKAGYDVWLGNQRGTKYSIGHKHLSTKSKDYWSFSWQEMGDFDAKAQVEYALKHSGEKKVAYIGHSQGTTQMFHALSNVPDYWEDKMSLFVALAPVSQLSHTTNPMFKYLSYATNEVVDAADLLRIYTVLGPVSSLATKAICAIAIKFCKLAEDFLITHDSSYDNTDRFQVYMGHFPAGASVQSLAHYGQMIKTKGMPLYDYGEWGNLDHYGQDTPPIVDISKIRVPSAMFSGSVDDLGDPKDVAWAASQFSDGVLKKFEQIPGGHLTFLGGNDFTYFKKVMTLLQEYHPVKSQEDLYI